MTTSQRRSALVESVATALSFAINDPSGHTSWALSQQHDSPLKRRRGVSETQRSATVFDSSAIPPIGIDRYLMRLSASFRCSDASFIAALIVVDRLLEYDGGRLPLTMRNVHRIFFASLVVAVKYHEDLVYSNSHYAKAGGVHLREVNRLERVLLAALDFDLRIEPEQYQTYEAALLALAEHGPGKKVSEGVPHKPLALEGAVAPSACAEDKAADLAAAPAPAVTQPMNTPVSATAQPANPSVSASLTTPPKALAPTASAAALTHWSAAATAPAATLLCKTSGRTAVSARPAVKIMTAGDIKFASLCPKPGPDMEHRVPWVVLPDRAVLNLDLGVLAGPTVIMP